MRIALALALCAVIVAFVAWRRIRAERAVAGERAHFFDDCLGIFDKPRLSQSGIEFPRLVGFVNGAEVQVTPVIDTLSVRKLPSLWLLVTLARPTPLGATFDLMIRPAGTEGFSNFHRLPVGVELPSSGWPERAVVRTDDPDGLPPAGVFEPHLTLFDNPRAKELLITPKGVRIVVQIAEAERTQYLVFRQAVFSFGRLDRAFLAGLVERMFAIHKDLETWKSRR